MTKQAGVVAGKLDGALTGAADLVRVAVLVGLLGVEGGGIAAAQLVAALAAHGLDVDFLVGVAADELVGGLEDVGVEGAGKALVAARQR